MNYIDLRSDTVTKPTQEMRFAMLDAEVGDDVYGDDPTIHRLEELAAQTLGKEAAIFVPSGTMGNQISVMTHTTPGDEIIAGQSCHIIHYEAGAGARLSGVGYALVDNHNHFIYADDVKRLTRTNDIHFPKTGLLCMENALCDGNVVPLDIMRETYEAAKALGIPVHLDGARIFNAALALGVDVSQLAACADSVMFCLSKGLCAPVGSMICGSKSFVQQARRNRKMMGGGMRQAGILAACGIIALTTMSKRLHEDHDNARYLGERLNQIPGIIVPLDRIKINMVFWKADIPGFDSDGFVAHLLAAGIKVNGISGDAYRFVTSNEVDKSKIDTVIMEIKRYIETLAVV